MSNKNIASSLALTVVFFLCSFVARADIVKLKNGDTLTGTVISKAGNELKIKTTYAGELTIDWKEVESLTTDKPVRVLLKDDTSLKATVSPAESGKVTLQSGSVIKTAPIALSNVAYINPPPEITGKGVQLKGRVNGAINATSGNTSTRQIHFDAEMVARTRSNRYTVGGQINRASDSGTETANNITAYSKYDHFLSRKRYVYINTRFERDKFTDLRLRTTLGGGLGHQFWESDEKNLSAEAGLAYVNEDHFVGPDDAYPAARWAVDYNQYFFHRAFQFFHKNEGTIGLTNANDILISAKTGIRVPLSKHLNTSFEVDAQFDNTPVAGKKKTDLAYLLILGYGW